MSSGFLSSALVKSLGWTRRLMSLASQERSARARNSPALYQCRLLAFTLPTITLFFKTAAVAISAQATDVTMPPCPTHRSWPRQFIEEGRPAWTVDCRIDSNGRGQWHRMSHRRILGISVAKVPHGASYRVAMYVGFMTRHMEDSEFRMLSTVYRPKSHLIEAMIFDRDQFYSFRGVRKTTSRLIGRFSGQFFSICIRCTQTRSDNWCRVPSLSGSNSAVECQLPKRIPHPYLIGFSLF